MREQKTIANRKLPQEEWNFCELEEEEVVLAFYYEYARDCPKVIREVNKMRAARPQPHIWNYCPRDHRLFVVIEWLAHQESFPETPFLRLRTEGRANFLKADNEHLRIAKEMNRQLPPDYTEKHVDPLTPERRLESVKPYEWMRLMLPESGTNIRPRINLKHKWLGDAGPSEPGMKEKPSSSDPPQLPTGQTKNYWKPIFKPQPEGSIFEFGINWLLTDAEILDDVSRIIKNARPKQFAAHAKKAVVQRGFDGTPLPFRMSNALDWLRVLRRRNCVLTWRDFHELYEAKKFTKDRDEREFQRGDENSNVEDKRKAEAILDWLEKGAALEPRAFK
jgi:hypothetical protein